VCAHVVPLLLAPGLQQPKQVLLWGMRLGQIRLGGVGKEASEELLVRCLGWGSACLCLPRPGRCCTARPRFWRVIKGVGGRAIVKNITCDGWGKDSSGCGCGPTARAS